MKLIAVLAVLFMPLLAQAAEGVTVEVDMTSAGRNVARPSPAHPAYYMPVMRGHHDYGLTAAGDKPVSDHEVVRVVSKELAKQGYLVINSAHPTPDIILNIGWGSVNLDEDTPPSVRSEMIALVMGRTVLDLAPYEVANRETYFSAADDSRFYVVVSAYDYAAFAKKKDHVPLWYAKMSIPRGGVDFGDVLVALVRSGAPSFGKESLYHPDVVPVEPGRVIIGTPVVRGTYRSTAPNVQDPTAAAFPH